MGICALCYTYISAITCAKFGVVVFKASMFDWRGSICPWVYVHCSIYIYLPLNVPSLVYWYSMHLCSIRGGLICYGYMCIVLYMKLIWCNGYAEIYAQ